MCTAWYHRAKWKKTFSIHFPMYGWSLSTRIGITLPKHIKAHLSQFVCCSMLKQNSYWVIFTAPHIINTYRKIWFVIRQWFGSSDKYGFDLFPLLFSFLSLSLSSSHLSYDIAQIRRTLITPFAIVTFPMDFLLYVLSHPDGLLLFCDCLRHVARNVPHFVRIRYEWYASHSVLSLSHTHSGCIFQSGKFHTIPDWNWSMVNIMHDYMPINSIQRKVSQRTLNNNSSSEDLLLQ